MCAVKFLKLEDFLEDNRHGLAIDMEPSGLLFAEVTSSFNRIYFFYMCFAVLSNFTDLVYCFKCFFLNLVFYHGYSKCVLFWLCN